MIGVTDHDGSAMENWTEFKSIARVISGMILESKQRLWRRRDKSTAARERIFRGKSPGRGLAMKALRMGREMNH